MIMAGLGLGVQVGVQLPFGRTHESEADLIGLDLMAKAGFNPQQSVNLWHNMAKIDGDNRQPEFLSTHPLPATRIQNLANNMPNAMKGYRLAKNKPNCKI
jgi:predicted Zn-dependent protease